jgi:hypothetical protein
MRISQFGGTTSFLIGKREYRERFIRHSLRFLKPKDSPLYTFFNNHQGRVFAKFSGSPQPKTFNQLKGKLEITKDSITPMSGIFNRLGKQQTFGDFVE